MIFDRMGARRAYGYQLLLFLASYVCLLVAAELTQGRFSPATTYLVAVGPALPIAGMVAAMLRYIERSDEFIRALTAKRFIIATGLSMALFSAWGFGESYADAPHAPGWLIFPLFWACFGVVSPFVKTTR